MKKDSTNGLQEPFGGDNVKEKEMKVIAPKNSMAIDSKRAPIARGESVVIDETEIHETGRFK